MMGKVMNNNQAIGQTQTGAMPGAKSALAAANSSGASGAKKGGKPAAEEAPGFEAQLAAAALITPTAPAQPALPAALAPALTAEAGTAQALGAQATGVKAGEAQGVTAGNAQILKATSSTTGSAIAGLKLPKSTSAWVFEGQNPMSDSTATTEASTSGKPATAEISAEQAARGVTDTALLSKLDLLTQVAVQDGGVGAQNAQAQLAPGVVPGELGAGATTAHDNAALEAQMAAMGGGVVQGLESKEGNGKGRSLVQGAKGKLPASGAAQAGLSGGEFLSALGAAKGGIAGSRGQGGQSGDAQGEGKGAMLGAKPSLRGLSKGAKDGAMAEFGTELTTTQSMSNLVGAQGGAKAIPIAMVAGAPTEVTANVVQGANAENRLSSETLAGIAGGLRNFSANNTGGEMRIRLKPENLGELHVRVITDGRNVGLQIQASDEKAKAVIEESMSHLKDSLAAQNLSLGTVDLTIAQSHGSSSGSNRGQDQGQNQSQWQGMSNDMLGQQNSGQGLNREGRGGGEEGGFGRSSRPATLGAPAAAQAFGPARAAYAASGRLDVTA